MPTNFHTFKFNKKYFLFSIILLITELFIALYVNDGMIRPYIGDMLAVILIYCSVKSFFDIRPLNLAIYTLIFAYTLELLQYLNLLDYLGLKRNKIATILLGGSFDWIDLINYTLGIIIVITYEKSRRKIYPKMY